MEVREAVEADAQGMADLAGSPPDVMRNLVHDRTVRVATSADDAGNGDGADLLGFVSFDARGETVHVTQLAGTNEACSRLLEEPIRFARGEGMRVELLVSEADDAIRGAVEDAGFTPRGAGPQFEGRDTTRYRLEPGKLEQ